MDATNPNPVISKSFDPAAARLTALVDAARARQRIVEAVRLRQGGVYDRILGRWVPAEAKL